MTTKQIKNDFHSLIDKVDDNETLKYFYDAFSYSSKKNWKLSEKEKKLWMV